MRSVFTYLAICMSLFSISIANAQEEPCHSIEECAKQDGATLRNLEGATPSQVVTLYYQDLESATSLWSLIPYVPVPEAEEDAAIAKLSAMPDAQRQSTLAGLQDRFLLADPEILAEAVAGDSAVVTVRGRKASKSESEPIWVAVTMERSGNAWKVSEPNEGHFTGVGSDGFGSIAAPSIESAVTRIINTAAGVEPVVDILSSAEVGDEAMVIARITPTNAADENDFFLTAINLLKIDGDWTVAGTHDY